MESIEFNKFFLKFIFNLWKKRRGPKQSNRGWAIVRKSLSSWMGLQTHARTTSFVLDILKGELYVNYKPRFQPPSGGQKIKATSFCLKNQIFKSFQARNTSLTPINSKYPKKRSKNMKLSRVRFIFLILDLFF